MKLLRKLAVALAIFGTYVGCAPVNFEKDTSMNRCQNFSQECLMLNGIDYFDYSITVGGGQVDILFVNDNSGSMSFEQTKIAQRFNSFIAQLDARQVDYHIGVVTTDISSSQNRPRAINKNGLLQDGRLIEFAPGIPYLRKDTPNKAQLFMQTMQRQETLQCDNFIRDAINRGLSRNSSEYQQGFYDNCPSGDERGVYAAYLALAENNAGFIRPRSSLAVVIISDENNRSQGITDPLSQYGLENFDLPETLVQSIQSSYGGEKTFTAHAIVVRTGDVACLNEQNAQMDNYVKGFYGTNYEKLAQLTGGVIGSVCAADYAAQMGQIGTAIVEQLNTLSLACSNPKDLEISISPVDSSNSFTVSGSVVHFEKALQPGSKVNLKYSCKTL